MTNSQTHFKKWFERQYASANTCFLCGEVLIKGTYTKEHIFPQWILNKFNLWDKSISLLNGIRYDYKRSIIPCCNICNNEHLSKLESIIKTGVERGYHYFKDNVPPLSIYQWCQLIFYKWIYKETFFKEDIRDPESEKIVKKENFDWMALNHLLLRSINKNISFENFFPGSIFICHLKTGAIASENFDYHDAVPEQCIMIRLGEIGIIGVLSDSNIQKHVFTKQNQPYLINFLAPVQFKNFFVQCVYRQRIFSNPYSFELKDITDDSLTLTQIPNNFFKDPVFGEWDREHYASLMSQVFGGVKNSYIIKGGIPSFLYDRNGIIKERGFTDDGTLPIEN